MMDKLKFFTLLFSAASLLTLSSCSEPDIPQGYALVYGVTDYTIYDALSFTDDDAIAVAELLESKGWEVTLGLDDTADMEDVIADVENLSAVMNENDRFLFYFSGHGGPFPLQGGEPSSAADSYDEIILLHGADSAVASYPASSSVEDVLNVTFSDDSLGELLSMLPTDNKTVILDACNTGGFLGDNFTYNTVPADYTKNDYSLLFTPAESVRMYLNYEPSDSDLPGDEYTVLSASGEQEYSQENPYISHGVFTYFLLQTPAYADYNLDGYISLIEAYRYTADQIDRLFNEGTEDDYMPHVSAFPVDPVLFKAD